MYKMLLNTKQDVRKCKDNLPTLNCGWKKCSNLGKNLQRCLFRLVFTPPLHWKVINVSVWDVTIMVFKVIREWGMFFLCFSKRFHYSDFTLIPFIDFFFTFKHNTDGSNKPTHFVRIYIVQSLMISRQNAWTVFHLKSKFTKSFFLFSRWKKILLLSREWISF